MTSLDSVDEEDDHLESAVGFMFDSLHSKTWKTFELPHQIQIKIQHIDDHPGHVQSGLYLWPAAEYACHHLARVWDEFKPQSMIELGAGCGLASLYASKLGGLHTVILTDYDRGCMDLLQNNIDANENGRINMKVCEKESGLSLNSLETITTTSCQLYCHVYKWGDDITPLLRLRQQSSDIIDSSSSSSTSSSSSSSSSAKCDMILGTDLLYCVDVVSLLFRSVSQLLLQSSPHSVFILVSSFDIGEVSDYYIELN